MELIIFWILFLAYRVNGLIVYVPITTSDVGRKDIYTDHDIVHQCTDLGPFGVVTDELTDLKFELQACSNAAVYVHDDVSIYNIYIGGYSNTWSVIRKRHENANFDKATLGATLLSCTDFKPFWFSWDQGFIKFGSGNQTEQNLIVSWNDPTPFVPTAASVCTGFGNTGKWLIRVNFPDGSYPVKRFNNCYLDNRRALLDVVFTKICSRVECSALCGSVSGFVGFNYHKTNRSCECLTSSSGVIKSPQILLEAGWEYYSKCSYNDICFGCFF